MLAPHQMITAYPSRNLLGTFLQQRWRKQPKPSQKVSRSKSSNRKVILFPCLIAGSLYDIYHPKWITGKHFKPNRFYSRLNKIVSALDSALLSAEQNCVCASLWIARRCARTRTYEFVNTLTHILLVAAA